ncbi:inositol 2-dehydrogenase [Shinella zoogloeoides]|uniref:inositol 2-dehydrogenase n=1 Tax=Shinella zoogloeoides TaxID=352475 RepID=UPI001F592BB0|nr:inositol 2-dehydrogenase [Shinella zoogloeoides]
MTRIALLGCGRIGKMHAATIARAEGAVLAAVYDPVAAAAEDIGRRHGCTVAASAQEAIALADAVLIATSTATHADLIEAAANAGKAIFCEKPIDLSLARVVACRKAIAGFDRPVQIGFNRRYDPGHRAARDAVHAGEIGNLQQVIITSRDPGLASRDYLKVSGGIFRDMTIHDFDLARFMLGEEPVEVFATGSTLIDPTLAEFGDVDSTMIILRTGSGKLCHINNSRAAAYGYDQRVELFGTKGMLISGNRRAHQVERFTATATGAGEPYLDFFIERYVEAFEIGLRSFLNCVAENRVPDVTFDDGEKALVLAETAIRSKTEGRFVKVEEMVGR